MPIPANSTNQAILGNGRKLATWQRVKDTRWTGLRLPARPPEKSKYPGPAMNKIALLALVLSSALPATIRADAPAAPADAAAGGKNVRVASKSGQ